MSTPRYLVAKYIPDYSRMEPRNIGILLWSSEGVRSRFIGEKLNPGMIDGRSVPPFVHDLSSYKEWVQLWSSEIRNDCIEAMDNSTTVCSSDPSFLDTLKGLSRGHFVLVDGGHLLDSVGDLDKLLTSLFTTLVAEDEDRDDDKDATLNEVTGEIFESTGLSKSPNFTSNFEIKCRIGEAEDRFNFSYAYRNGSLNLIQRVSFPKTKAAAESKVHSTAWMFDRVVKAGEITKEHGFSLVYLTPEMNDEPNVRQGVNVLKEVSTVVNLHDQRTNFSNRVLTWRMHEELGV